MFTILLLKVDCKQALFNWDMHMRQLIILTAE
jgi:hypothetical protein